MRLGVIGGTGLSSPSAEHLAVETPWGEVPVAHWREGDIEVFFVQRHGIPARPPHRIAHRANVDALARCKVDAILAVNAVGAVDPALPVPSLVAPEDVLDLRKTTESFFDERAVHVDMSEPYCPHLRALLAPHVSGGGVYACVEGPRLETRAEVRMLRALGAGVVGMTGMPEAALARERALCYASVCMVVNAAAGVREEPLSAAAIKRGAETLAPQAMRAVLAAAKKVDARRSCACRSALEGASL